MTSIFLDVVYFDQQAGALHHVSPSNELFLHVFVVSANATNKSLYCHCTAILPCYTLLQSLFCSLAFLVVFQTTAPKKVSILTQNYKQKQKSSSLFMLMYADRPAFVCGTHAKAGQNTYFN